MNIQFKPIELIEQTCPILISKNAGGRLQLNTHAPYVCDWDEYSDTVNCSKVVWCTRNVRRDGNSFTWNQPLITKQRCKYAIRWA